MHEKVECAKCPGPVCNSPGWDKGPENCPIKIKPEVIKKATEKCFSPEFQEFAKMASLQEGSGYMRLPHAPKGPAPVKSRVEEIMEFSRKMGYKRLGVAFCGGVAFEAGMLVPILEKRGFEVVSVSCKCGSVQKEDLDIKGSGPLGVDIEVDKSKDWVDAIVGGRVQLDLSEKFTFSLRGDAGGFDIGSSSDLVWNLVAALGYELSDRTTLWLGYRHLDIDYDDGSGSSLFEYDVEMTGPVFGLAILF